MSFGGTGYRTSVHLFGGLGDTIQPITQRLREFTSQRLFLKVSTEDLLYQEGTKESERRLLPKVTLLLGCAGNTWTQVIWHLSPCSWFLYYTNLYEAYFKIAWSNVHKSIWDFLWILMFSHYLLVIYNEVLRRSQSRIRPFFFFLKLEWWQVSF